LAGVGGDVFDKDKKPIAPTNKDAKAGTHDPNYMTLAGIGGDVFNQK
jgi:hypothetical protein